MNQKYKDKCERCNSFQICKGYNGKVLCSECIEKEKEIIDNKVEDKKGLVDIKGQTNIFDFL